MSFTDFNLQKDFIKSIEAAGYKSPTPLQSQLIPLVAERKSALVLSQSTSGKTGAFLIPAINYILEHPDLEKRGARILILTSRRDRVSQINYTIKRLSRDHNMRFGFIVSGRPYQTQMRLMRRPLDIMIATPGRLNDLMENKKADFSQLEILIVDDLSSIYRKNLQGLVENILNQTSDSCQSLVFVNDNDEATNFAKKIFNDSIEINVTNDNEDNEHKTHHEIMDQQGSNNTSEDNVPSNERDQLNSHPQSKNNQQPQETKQHSASTNKEQFTLPEDLMLQHVYVADDYTHKVALMDHFLDEFAGEPTIIYTSTHKVAKTLQENLTNHGHSAELAQDLSSDELTSGGNDTLIISDQEKNDLHHVLPQGFDTHIIHFDLPFKTAKFIQRLHHHNQKRSDAAILVVDGRNYSELKQIEKAIGENLEQTKVPGLEPLQPFVNKSKPKQNRKPQKQGNKNANHQQANNNGKKNNDSKNKRQRKGPFGRLNGGVHRKQSSNSKESNDANNKQNKNAGNRSNSNTPRNQQNKHKKRGPKIGVSTRGTRSNTSDRAWQSDFAEPQERKTESKRVVIRYKDKKRSLITEKTDDDS